MLKDLPSKLASTQSIRATFVLTIVLTVVFRAVSNRTGIEYIDFMYKPDLVRAHIEEMTQTQRMIHAWVTATVDVVYPFCYAGFVAGLNLRFLGRAGLILAGVAAAAVGADVVEGVLEVIALHGGFYTLGLKAIVTPFKFTCIGIAAVGALVAGGIGLKRRFSSSV